MKPFLFTILFCIISTATFAQSIAPGNGLTLRLPSGNVVIELLPGIAPKTVEQIKILTGQGFYDRLEWFRVIPGFIAQTGYPKGSKGKSALPDLPAEFSKHDFRRGTLGMGHGADINSANSQFFICLSDEKCASLTGQYTAFGMVISGMEHVDALPAGEPPSHPARTLKAFIGDDLRSASPPARRHLGNQ